jgi:hypothetical protein
MFSLVGLMGAMMALGGSVGFFAFPAGLSMGIKMFVNLAEKGMVYPLYMKPPVGPASSYYLFHIKNPKEVLRGKKPTFQPKGPYRYNTTLVRDRIKFSPDGEKVTFDSSRKLSIDEEHSANFDEKIWLINPIIPSTANVVKSLVLDRIPFRRMVEPVVFNAVNLLLDNFKERLVMRTTARSLLEGRKVEMLEAIQGLADRFGAGTLVPPGPPQNIFGIAYIQNQLVDNYELWTGVGKTRDKFAEVAKFRGKDRLDVWSGKCNAITGTNGELHKPFVKVGQPLRIFLGPICRSFNLDPASEGPVLTKSGLMALEYELTGRLFQGSRTNPSNKCFCKDARTYDCQYDGLMSMGPCFFDAPIFFTRGQFKGVDPKISNLIDSESTKYLNRSQEDSLLPSDQVFKVEPITGTILGVDLALMGTIKVVRQPYMRDLGKVQNLSYVPLFMTREKLDMPFSVVWQVYLLQKFNDYHKPIMAGTALSGVGILAVKLLFG